MKKGYYHYMSLRVLTNESKEDEKLGYKTATVAVQLVYQSESGY